MQNCVCLFYYFYFERNYDVLKSKSPCILLNKNVKFNKNKTESKMENPKPLIHGQIPLIKLIWHIFWINNCSIKFYVYTIKLIWSKLWNWNLIVLKLITKKWAHLTRRCHPTQLHFFCCLKIFEFLRVECPKIVYFSIHFFSKGKYSCEQRCI